MVRNKLIEVTSKRLFAVAPDNSHTTMIAMKRIWIVWSFCICALISPATGFSYDNGHYNIIQEGVEAWNKVRKSEPEKRFDLSGAVLKGKNLKGIDFSNTDLQGASFIGADLSDADLRRATLDSAKLKQVLLYDAILRQASLRDTDLEEAGLDGADLRGAILDGAVLKQADLANSILRGASLRGVDLRASNLREADLAGCNLDGAYLWRAVLDGANLEEALVTPVTVVETGSYADQSWADKKGAVLSVPESADADSAAAPVNVVDAGSGADQVLAEKTGAVLSNPENQSIISETESGGQETPAVVLEKTWPVNPVQQKIRFGVTRKNVGTLSYDVHQRELLVDSVSRWNKMRKSNPTASVRLAGAKLSRKVLDSADLQNADLSDAQLKRTDLVDADLRGADLRDANLREADLTNANLGGADLRGAYFWRANLSWTVLNGAIVNSLTILETGKNATPEWAKKAGAVFRDQSDTGD